MPRKSKSAMGHTEGAPQEAIIPVPTAVRRRRAKGCPPQMAEWYAPGVDELIDLIRGQHRLRCYAMEQRKRLDNALGALIRTSMGWSLKLPETERRYLAKLAQDAIEDNSDPAFADVVEATAACREPFEKIEADCLKEMERLARLLPVWASFAEPIRGFGAASLAVIVAEAGDLSAYPTKSALWKRMGLALVDDVRQGGLPKGAPAELWVVHGYSPKRRSRVWNIGDALIKSNREGEYRTTYLVRKAYELERDPAMTPMHAHRRAQRYMEKRLLKHLWQAWRRTIGDKPSTALSLLSDAEVAA